MSKPTSCCGPFKAYPNQTELPLDWPAADILNRACATDRDRVASS